MITLTETQDLRGGSSNRAFHPVNGRIACGSMVLFDLFHKNFARSAKFL
jgi:hypothetical protein